MILFDELPTVRVIPVDVKGLDMKEVLKDPLYLLIEDRLYRIVEIPTA